jgi:hypothetical protein
VIVDQVAQAVLAVGVSLGHTRDNLRRFSIFQHDQGHSAKPPSYVDNRRRKGFVLAGSQPECH